MRSSIFVALALAPFALAQFGLGDDGSAFGGDDDAAVAACTTGDNAGCSAYITAANNCYQLSETGTEEDAIACACDASFLSAFKTCAACVYDAAGADSSSSQLVDSYAAQFTEYCNEAVTVDGSTSSSSSSASATATDDASSSKSSSAGSSAGATSAGAQANATATTEVVGASPTGAGAREAVGVAGMVGLVFSAMVLVA
ncbi:hypothetical protein BCR35DRAFT_307780 [Leucosporidium creatinivorum]|uniref:Extracellular membrane protein CFEM domain-containing protein n=1 Tax=Leucosporidium creatinivorum TaxID=106004 RepID=A0A1Y2EKY6_9BASI|nr:hypothetical protein BCR35DRAFT_307780 [Leucosporidium creatinivorum]